MNELMISLFEGWQREVQVNLTVNWLLLALSFSKPPFARQQYQSRGWFFFPCRPDPCHFQLSSWAPFAFHEGLFYASIIRDWKQDTPCLSMPQPSSFYNTSLDLQIWICHAEEGGRRVTPKKHCFTVQSFKLQSQHIPSLCSLLLNKYVFMQMSEKCGVFIPRLFQPLCELMRTSLHT